MKKTAIILLALIVGFCLAQGAFGEDYMVVVIGVKSGHIKEVYGTDNIKPMDKEGKLHLPVKEPLYHTSNGHSDGDAKSISNKISETPLKTIYAKDSPGCRYIWHPAGYYVKVCK